jgi:hypothetical protein
LSPTRSPSRLSGPPTTWIRRISADIRYWSMNDKRHWVHTRTQLTLHKELHCTSTTCICWKSTHCLVKTVFKH